MFVVRTLQFYTTNAILLFVNM